MENSTSRVFSANLISEYFNNQTPYTGSEMYEDPAFPPDRRSLLALREDDTYIDLINGPKNVKEIDQNLKWKRASEILCNPKVFEDGLEFKDITQGNIGDCYFLSAVTALVEFPQLIKQLFKTPQNQGNGYYEIILFLNGKWQVVIVDDYVPVNDDGTIQFANPNNNELWVILLEKAWAKVNGGYLNIISGKASEVYKVLTGFPCLRYTVEDTSKDELWKIAETSDDANNFMCSGTRSDTDISQYGLVEGHAYTLISAKELEHNGETHRLLKIRNPWGSKEWKGKWSDQSDMWTEELKEKLAYSNQNDGIFWIEFHDFCSVFEDIEVSYVIPNSNILSHRVNYNIIHRPHVFNLVIPQDCHIGISVCRQDWRFNRSMVNKNYPISIVIAKYERDNKYFTNIKGEYHSDRDVDFYGFLSNGLYVVWVYHAWEVSDDPKLQEYYVRFNSPCQYKLMMASLDTSFEFIRMLIISGVKESYSNEIEGNSNFYKSENNFKKSGIGYICIKTSESSTYYWMTCNSTELLNMFLFPPFYNKDNCGFGNPPGDFAIILGMKKSYWGSYCFSPSNTYNTYSCNEGEDPTKTRKTKIETYISPNILTSQVDLGYYDYCSTNFEISTSETSNNYTITVSSQDQLIETHPKIMQLLKELDSVENDENLIWSKTDTDNGYFIGQIDNNQIRNGKGAYYWQTENEYYIGYWKSGSKNGYCKFLKGDFKTFYEGQIENDDWNGEGILNLNIKLIKLIRKERTKVRVKKVLERFYLFGRSTSTLQGFIDIERSQRR
jgi:hypothetical protein